MTTDDPELDLPRLAREIAHCAAHSPFLFTDPEDRLLACFVLDAAQIQSQYEGTWTTEAALLTARLALTNADDDAYLPTAQRLHQLWQRSQRTDPAAQRLGWLVDPTIPTPAPPPIQVAETLSPISNPDLDDGPTRLSSYRAKLGYI
jgi:hypothetical protein